MIDTLDLRELAEELTALRAKRDAEREPLVETADRAMAALDAIPDDHDVQPLQPGDPAKVRATCGTCGLSWDDGVSTGITPTPAGRCPFEAFHADMEEPEVERLTDDERERLAALESIESDLGSNDLESYARDESTAVNESSFEEYAQELAEELGCLPKDAKWPANHIDWKAAADELRQDYSSFEYEGATYLVRSV